MHPHKEEICRWANSPEGTKVWRKSYDDWDLFDNPIWDRNKIYITNNEWAELRKAQVDGKQLQYEDINGEWKDDKFTLEKSKYYTIEQWRIKPKKLTYKWQWLYKDASGKWRITYHHHERFNSNIFTEIQKWEPSKRLKNEN